MVPQPTLHRVGYVLVSLSTNSLVTFTTNQYAHTNNSKPKPGTQIPSSSSTLPTADSTVTLLRVNTLQKY
ncbi:hypothetical protein CY34DRAFT_808765 [Suillus luteus UH-Slu-Lm8-n1]|uniref:Uncharacterized protein n=1 Tax=Suillus luteus UH-Slu-Lm8-n1 TaxID=930992 RepID=A0A0D0B5B2_9AGAM|nr:hypothetical protein CY34DRAFT_808765 [Suillus luteus UH-Slu-Lm8-n1]